MDEERRRDVRQLKFIIDDATRILLAAHVNPDGDTLGGVLALYHGLRLGKEVIPICHDPVPQNLRFLPGAEKVICAKEKPKVIARLEEEPADLAIIVDMNSPSRLGLIQPLVDSAKRFAIIDHHPPPEPFSPGLRLTWPDYSATCLILYDILGHLGIPFTKNIAQCLLTGIATDTGNFRYGNTDPKSLRAAAHLLELGANISQIAEHLWEKKPLSAMKLMARAIENMQTFAKQRLVISRLSEKDFRECGGDDEDTDNIVNILGWLETAEIYALFREFKKGKVRVSVRSKGEINIATVCQKFGGGGHPNAAGCTIEGSLSYAMEKVGSSLERLLTKKTQKDSKPQTTQRRSKITQKKSTRKSQKAKSATTARKKTRK
ncbi:MAG: bifunctional oligoribonuclease/PAP phosphatase NrnA [Candidatus Caldarchaeum sp.]